MKELLSIRSIGENNSIRDESLFTGHAYSISSPRSVDEVCQIVKYCSDNQITITPHGGLTGINGAGAATNNHSMSLQNLSAVSYCDEDHTLWAQAGATFSDIETAVRKGSNMTYEFPASPTEKSATIGGAISFDAHGLRSYKYGSVSCFVTEIEYCDYNGNLHHCNNTDDTFHELLSSEGMFAIITGVRLRTVPISKYLWGLMFFFPDSICATGFADAISTVSNISVFEFCDSKSFELIHEFQSQISSISRIPELPSINQACIYLELESDSEEELEETAESLLSLTEDFHGDPDNIWTLEGDDVESLRLLRHAISECINLKIACFHAHDVQIKKLSCSCFFPDKNRTELIEYYQKSLEQHHLSGVIFGHIGSGKPYINFLPNSTDEYHKARKLIEIWSKDAFESGGYAFSECGVGKLYNDIFFNVAPIELLNKKIKLKQKWDPYSRFNPHNMLV